MTAPIDGQDLQERLERLHARLDGLTNLKTKLRKLNIALGSLPIMEGQAKKLARINASAKYVAELGPSWWRLRCP